MKSVLCLAVIVLAAFAVTLSTDWDDADADELVLGSVITKTWDSKDCVVELTYQYAKGVPGWQNAVITVKGEGEMEDYSENMYGSNVPWRYYSEWNYLIIGNVSKIVIEEGVTHVGSYSFKDFVKAKEVILPQSLESIGGSAFSYSGIESIHIPDSVKVIGLGAFSNCPNLYDVIIGSSVERIDPIAFNRCPSLKSLVLPESLTILGRNAIPIWSMQNLYLPSSLEIIFDPYVDLGAFTWYDHDGNALEPTVENLRGHMWTTDGAPLYSFRMDTAGESEEGGTGPWYDDTISGKIWYIKQSIKNVMDCLTDIEKTKAIVKFYLFKFGFDLDF